MDIRIDIYVRLLYTQRREREREKESRFAFVQVRSALEAQCTFAEIPRVKRSAGTPRPPPLYIRTELTD